jgi:hypothetical protein
MLGSDQEVSGAAARTDAVASTVDLKRKNS